MNNFVPGIPDFLAQWVSPFPLIEMGEGIVATLNVKNTLNVQLQNNRLKVFELDNSSYIISFREKEWFSNI